MKNMKKVLSLILALAMVFSLAACGGSTAETGSGDAEEAAATEEVVATNDSEPAYGGEVTLYYPKFYNFFDPAMINEYQYSFWFETLWTIDLTKSAEYSFDACATPVEDMTGQIAVDMGEMNYETGELTVTLRDDVYFQDKEPYNGRALTADDVVWSYSRLLGLNGLEKVVIEDSPSDWATTLYMLEAVEAKDEHTVVFTLGENYRNEVGYAAFVNVKVNIGGTEWDDLTDEQKSDWNYAAGTGPYILTEYVADNSMKLEKNENYYDYDDRYPENKLPYIDVINLIYLEDTANVLAQAMAGSLDWFGENGKNVLDNTQLAQLADAATGYTQEYLSGSPVAIGLKVSQDQFSDVKVREAMQHAIDIEGISQVYFNIAPEDLVIPGLWSPSLNGWSTVGSWSEDLSSQFTYDPELAKELLAEAGYPDGFTFTIQLDPTANMSIYEEAKTELAAVGITMEIEVASEMMEAVSVSQDPTDERQFNTFGGGYSAVSLANMMVGDNSAQLQVETNGFNHDNQEVFDLLAQIQSATTVDEQASIAQQLDQIFPENHWAIDLTGVQPTYDWISSRIGGYSGEKVYYDNNMRTIWSRLWVSE